MVSALTRTRLQDGYVSYPWERRMQELLHVPNSSSFLSVLLLPKASDRAASRYNDLEDTLARANAWLNASQASGVPIVFMNVQTESLLTKVNSLITTNPFEKNFKIQLGCCSCSGIPNMTEYLKFLIMVIS